MRVVVGSPRTETNSRLDSRGLRSTHTVFKVTLVPEEAEENQILDSVERRFRDFVWLEDTLQSEVPGAIIPVLPDKDFPVAAQNKSFLDARATACTVFLEEVVCNPEVCASTSARDKVTIFLKGSSGEFADLKQRPNKLTGSSIDLADDDDEINGTEPVIGNEATDAKKTSWGASVFAAATAITRAAGDATARLRTATASRYEKTSDEVFVETMLEAVRKKVSVLEGAEKKTRGLLACVEKLTLATSNCGMAIKGASEGNGTKSPPDNSAASGSDHDSSVHVKDSSLTFFKILAEHQVGSQTAALKGLLQRQIIGLFEPLRANLLAMRGVTRALQTVQALMKARHRLTKILDTKKFALQRAYDNPKTLDGRKQELKLITNTAQLNVDNGIKRENEAVERFRREHKRFEAQKIALIRDVLLVWSKLHKFHHGSTGLEWRGLHEEFVGSRFSDGSNFEFSKFEAPASVRPTVQKYGGDDRMAEVENNGQLPAEPSVPGGNFDDEVSV